MPNDATRPWNDPDPDDEREPGRGWPPPGYPGAASRSRHDRPDERRDPRSRPRYDAPDEGRGPRPRSWHDPREERRGAPSRPVYDDRDERRGTRSRPMDEYPGGRRGARSRPVYDDREERRTARSRPVYDDYPDDRRGGRSRPMYDAPGGYPGGPPAAPSRPLYDYPGGWPAAAPPRPRRSRRGLWIALGVVAALLLAIGGGGVFALVQYVAPAGTAGAFCGELKVRNYAAAYDMLGSRLLAQVTAQGFAQDAATLDTVEGDVTACGLATTAGAYEHSLGGGTARVALALRRSTAGILQGTLQLTDQNGAWRVSALDPALLGIDLGALDTANVLCADLQAANYGAEYGLLAPTAAGGAQSLADFTQAAKLHDQIDGPISRCAVVGIAPGASASAGTVTLSLTRAKLAARRGQVSLEAQGGGWRIAQLDGQLLGTDIGPILVGQRFCADLAGANYADAYSLLSAAQQGVGSEAQFAGDLAPPVPLKWGGCTPDLTTYKVDTQQASYTAALAVVDPTNGATTSANFMLSFVVEGGAWKLDDLTQV